MSDGDGGPLNESTVVTPELSGREVSARLLPPLLDGALRKGIRLETLAKGTGYSASELRNHKDRIRWASFMTFVENLGHALSDEELIALGGVVLDSPRHRALLLPGRLLFSLPEIYRWGARPTGPLAQLLVAQNMSVTELGERALRLDVTMKPGYTCVRAFWLLRLGFLRSVPRAFGLTSAKVSLSVTPNGATYEIELPPSGGVLRRIRMGTSWLLAARSTARELKQANDDLHERYLELQREIKARSEVENKLRLLNAELETRVLERTAALERVNRDLAASIAELEMFSSAIAHDLRTPLRAISGFAELLIEALGGKLDAESSEHLDRIRAGAIRMGNLIDAILALSRVTRAEIRRTNVDLATIARSVVEDLRVVHPDRVVELAIESEMNVDGDPVLLRALMENLIGNAWKFTRDRMPARIEVTRVDTSPVDVFRVRDNGAGFDMKHAGRLFVPFQRLHPSEAFDGTGIGLALADRIVRRHGGKIWVESARGAGAAFSFTLRPELPTASEKEPS